MTRTSQAESASDLPQNSSLFTEAYGDLLSFCLDIPVSMYKRFYRDVT